MPFDKNFVPALRFAVMSDIHIDDEDCIEEQRFAKALDDLKNLCSSDERYSGFDALVIVGDFASRGSEIQNAQGQEDSRRRSARRCQADNDHGEPRIYDRRRGECPAPLR
ncbi:MAG: metallophosphoesterase [Acutalibacteraceae bacterium]